MKKVKNRKPALFIVANANAYGVLISDEVSYPLGFKFSGINLRDNFVSDSLSECQCQIECIPTGRK